MMKPKLHENLISFVTIRRNNWVMKISVFKNNSILIVGKHYFDNDKMTIKFFTNQSAAADYIESLAITE